MTAHANRASNLFIRCPHCETKANVRTSEQQTRTMRSLICQCTNAFCAYTFVASLEAIRTIAPSAMPHPEIDLPRTINAETMERSGSLSSYKKPRKKNYHDHAATELNPKPEFPAIPT
ncbi:ogr/Delta-like zinc finger family protein [Comamonas koreensis]|uniref:Ogr/Delta-like zinc finger family protein n=1 Tax=Comamonas koreensis TaxID=160825 RepID=A0AAW4XRN9_9BURK|nr:ogr/Delta-like zinc finger family protein [Comamonas koreensis]MCD2163815.1 ogr/Delta-like zinc finger family protein [Comamonas koreensis]